MGGLDLEGVVVVVSWSWEDNQFAASDMTVWSEGPSSQLTRQELCWLSTAVTGQPYWRRRAVQ